MFNSFFGTACSAAPLFFLLWLYHTEISVLKTGLKSQKNKKSAADRLRISD